jgi:hypothetical protein
MVRRFSWQQPEHFSEWLPVSAWMRVLSRRMLPTDPPAPKSLQKPVHKFLTAGEKNICSENPWRIMHRTLPRGAYKIDEYSITCVPQHFNFTEERKRLGLSPRCITGGEFQDMARPDPIHDQLVAKNDWLRLSRYQDPRTVRQALACPPPGPSSGSAAWVSEYQEWLRANWRGRAHYVDPGLIKCGPQERQEARSAQVHQVSSAA